MHDPSTHHHPQLRWRPHAARLKALLIVAQFAAIDAGCRRAESHARASRPSTPTPTPTPTMVDPQPSVAEATTFALRRLAEDAVFHHAWWRRDLFSWTTVEQANQLREQRVLLTRTHSPSRGPAYFTQVMHRRATQDQDRVAQMLQRPAFRRVRFAWASPWPVVLGFESETYGTELLHIRLRPEALLARYQVSRATWDFADTDGHRVTVDAALAHPERIAAVYFVRDDDTFGDERDTTTFREYVLCNESMIETWSLGDDVVRDRIQRDVATIDALLSAYSRGGDNPAASSAGWDSPPKTWTLDAAWTASLAFDTGLYRNPRGVLRTLLLAMRSAIPRTEAVTHRPTLQFALDTGPALPPMPQRARPRTDIDTF